MESIENDGSLTQSPDDEAGPTCWICLGGPGDSGEPLRRDCSCRGEAAGFAHASCLVDYAKNRCAKEMDKPWSVCPICKQRYRNDLADELTTEFVRFAEENYPDTESRHLAFSLLARLDAIVPAPVLFRLDPSRKEEADKIATRLLSIIQDLKTKSPTRRTRCLEFLEFRLNFRLGSLGLHGCTAESARNALEHFERSKSLIMESRNDVDVVALGVASMMTYIAQAKTKCEGGSQTSIMEEVEQCQATYNHWVKSCGQDHHQSVVFGLYYVDALHRAAKTIEAKRLLKQLVPACCRIHGPDHLLTKKGGRTLKAFKELSDHPKDK